MMILGKGISIYHQSLNGLLAIAKDLATYSMYLSVSTWKLEEKDIEIF